MEAGRCCITTNNCGQRDLIRHGENGLLHEADDAEKLAELIATCALDEDLRLRLGKTAKRDVQDRQWPRVSAEVVDRIEQQLQLKPIA
jgi:glycosyltransferase involved in cell wall biosynthesis